MHSALGTRFVNIMSSNMSTPRPYVGILRVYNTLCVIYASTHLFSNTVASRLLVYFIWGNNFRAEKWSTPLDLQSKISIKMLAKGPVFDAFSSLAEMIIEDYFR